MSKYNVYHVIPWNTDKNIGRSYNQTMSLIDKDDWVCFLDGDAVHTTHFFGSRIEQIINGNPEYSLFTCYTNRVNCNWQIPNDIDLISNDQKYHREFGEKLWELNKTNVKDVTSLAPLSGVLILIKKSAWELVGGFKEEKMLGVDNDLHLKFRDNELKVGLMKGIYVQHWYRNGNKKDKDHLL